jgi:hypothetical protein
MAARQKSSEMAKVEVRMAKRASGIDTSSKTSGVRA